jgi:hypothetical protein
MLSKASTSWDCPGRSTLRWIARRSAQLGVVEHLTYGQVTDTFKNVHRMLEPGGAFYFDVPDVPVWCRYVVDHFEGREIPFTIDHVFATLYGWQRWPGDEHKSGWWRTRLEEELRNCGFLDLKFWRRFVARQGTSSKQVHAAARRAYLLLRHKARRWQHRA